MQAVGGRWNIADVRACLRQVIIDIITVCARLYKDVHVWDLPISAVLLLYCTDIQVFFCHQLNQNDQRVEKKKNIWNSHLIEVPFGFVRHDARVIRPYTDAARCVRSMNRGETHHLGIWQWAPRSEPPLRPPRAPRGESFRWEAEERRERRGDGSDQRGGEDPALMRG